MVFWGKHRPHGNEERKVKNAGLHSVFRAIEDRVFSATSRCRVASYFGFLRQPSPSMEFAARNGLVARARHARVRLRARRSPLSGTTETSAFRSRFAPLRLAVAHEPEPHPGPIIQFVPERNVPEPHRLQPASVPKRTGVEGVEADVPGQLFHLVARLL